MKAGRMIGMPGWVRLCGVAVPLAVAIYAAVPARAADLIADWPTIQMPPPPQLKPVTVDPKTTALFLFDFMVYPVDCLPSESAFREAYAAWRMAGGGPPVTTKWVTVTRSDMIKFKNAKP